MANLRSLRSLFKIIALLSAIFLLILGFGFVRYSDRVFQTKHISTENLSSPSEETSGGALSPGTVPTGLPRKPNDTLVAQAPEYIQAILNPSDPNFSRLECQQPNLDRYAYLRHPPNQSEVSSQPRYFFALDLHQCVHILPRLLGSIVETITFLGSENCVLSIVEGRSDDGTFEVLHELRPRLQALGVKYFFQTSDIDPTAAGKDRIEALAGLRNLALQDLLNYPEHYDPDTTIIFLNDIALCTDDILELLHQRNWQGADQTCAMDWTYVGENPTFYDVWIARGMTGDTFFKIPEDGSWDFAWNLFWNDDKARARLAAAKPFQVFACWNGVTSFTAKPLLDGRIKFRARGPGECFQGEPKLFAKDMWANGYGKIAVVPSVNVEYSDEATKKIKALKGYVVKHIGNEGNEGNDGRIEWETKPPEKVKCMPDYQHQTFIDWDEGLRPRVSAKAGK
ncbi:alpha-1,3-mannosyltransferase CMT1 [Boeremia exigua]|uniref:alpha-1,3-mannosyltransferase CMT1 n=1 Tax=Boeremia exigua TaxID=749465 RepID=UPI001E8D4606|nr:alpha-1,3-mannosyltransferase CMT1 [Boeremia exigua]KAH6642466.1 alpha-1,3-mannosyltransferase CMT1 [Boeremia exigua]